MLGSKEESFTCKNVHLEKVYVRENCEKDLQRWESRAELKLRGSSHSTVMLMLLSSKVLGTLAVMAGGDHRRRNSSCL